MVDNLNNNKKIKTRHISLCETGVKSIIIFS
jgi:hypothetical protein